MEVKKEYDEIKKTRLLCALPYAFQCLFYFIIYNRWAALMGIMPFSWQSDSRV